MTALQPYARLIDMRTNTVLASTSNVVAGRIGRVLDKPGPRSISVPLNDAGDSADATHGFTNALLAAVGGPGVATAPVPTLCEVSFDGGATVDARFMVERVTPDLHSGTLLATADGDDSGVLYHSIGPDRFPATNLALADVLGGATGAIVPKSAGNYGISTAGAIPNLRGLLVPKPGSEPGGTPGSPMWASAASARVTMVGVLSNALSSAIAFLGVTIQSWEDTTGRIITSLVKQLGGVVFSADTLDQGSRGHAVWCDSDVNLSGDIAGVVCDGTPTQAAPAGTLGYSNDATNHPNGIPRALVIGNVGGNPHGVAFTFDGTSSAALTPAQEASTARLLAEETTITPDLSTLYSEVRAVGGTSDAGIPQGAVLTAIVTLNNIPADTPKVAYTDVLPIVAANVQDQVGALYFDVADGRLRLLPSWTLGLPIYDLAVDGPNNVIYVATAQGVWSHSTTGIATSTTAWTRVGNLTHKVTRLQGVAGAALAFWLYAQVNGLKPEENGVYQYTVSTPTTQTLVGYDKWIRFIPQEVHAFTATDGTSGFMLLKTDNQANLWYYDATNATTPWHPWALGTGISGTRLDRVTVGATDSVWVSLAGGAQPAKYLVYSAGWITQTLQNADQDASLAAAVGTTTGITVVPQINRATQVGYGINGVNVAVMLCTTVGIYYLPGTAIPAGGGTSWSGQSNGMNGLAGVSISALVSGQATEVPDPNAPATAYVGASRIYAISPNAYYYSYSDARYWRDLLRAPLTLGPFFYNLAGSIPSWAVQTIGPMAASPIGGPSGSHIQVAGCLPTGWYWRRRWSYTLEPYYALVNSSVPFPAQLDEPMSELAVTPSENILGASTDLATLAVLLLGARSTKQTTLTVHSFFSQQASGLRYLWPSHAVAVSQSGTMKQISSTGFAVDTPSITLSAAPFFVLSHEIAWDGPQFTTQTTLGSTLRGTPQTGHELAAAIVQDTRRIRVHGLRPRH